MVPYLINTPKWFRWLFPKEMIWDIPNSGEPSVYITFDDGPNPNTTPFVLEQLDKYGAKATFFCVGNNITKHPSMYEELLRHGHATGNHTFNHLNGWKTDNETYQDNIALAKKYIDSNLFRPPYGMMRSSQFKTLMKSGPAWKTIMWDVLSGDFDQKLTGQQCVKNVLGNIRPGSIVLLHDSEKAWPRMSYALPLILEYCRNQNWKMKSITGY